MKIFVAGPLINNKYRDLEYYESIANICNECGFEVFLPHLETEPIDKPANADIVFKQDFKGLEESSMLIAEVSNPSHGVGCELMQAYFLKIPIVCLSLVDKELSRMVIGNPMVKKIIVYRNRKECLAELKRYLLNRE